MQYINKKLILLIKHIEIKDNKLVINTPKGMVIDVENSNLKEGIIKFRKKDIDYRDVCISLNTCDSPIVVSNTNWEKTKAISQLMDIADYYNKGWKPDWDNGSEKKCYIAFDTESSFYEVRCGYIMSCHIVYFKNRKDAQAVIDNPNFREILDKIYKS